MPDETRLGHADVTMRMALLLLLLLHVSPAAAGIDPLLDRTARKGGFSAAEVREAGTLPQPRIYERESKGREVTVLGIARIPASPQTITADLLKREGLLKSEALRQLGVFSEPPNPGDVAGFRMPESDIEALADCEVGDCRMKLGRPGVEFVQHIDWSAPGAYEQVNERMKQGLLHVAGAYQEDGNVALPVSVDKGSSSPSPTVQTGSPACSVCRRS